MPIRYSVLKNHRLLVGHFRGALSVADYLAGIEDVAQNPDFQPDFDRLAVLHDSLDLSGFSLAEIFTIKQKLADAYFDGVIPGPAEKHLYRIAAVSGPTVNRAIFNMYNAVLDKDTPWLADAKLFDDLAAALEWLGLGDADPDLFDENNMAFKVPKDDRHAS